MAYTPTTWTTGDTVTSTKLNKIENGIANAGSALICASSYDSQQNEYVLDKTVLEIYEALIGGVPVYIKYQYGGDLRTDYSTQCYLAPVIGMANYAFTAQIRIIASKPARKYFDNDYYNYAGGVIVYSATSINDYPTYIHATTIDVTSASQSSVGDLL